MIPLPLPNVQKSSKPLWPVASSSTNHDGDGAASNAGAGDGLGRHDAVDRPGHEQARLVRVRRAVAWAAGGQRDVPGDPRIGGCGEHRPPTRGVADGADAGDIDVATEAIAGGRVGRGQQVERGEQFVDRGGGISGRRATEDVVQVPAGVLGCGDDHAPRGEVAGEEGRLLADAGVAVGEQHERERPVGHRCVARPGERVARGEVGGQQLAHRRRHGIAHVVADLAGRCHGCRVPHLDGRPVRQGERRDADGVRAGVGERDRWGGGRGDRGGRGRRRRRRRCRDRRCRCRDRRRRQRRGRAGCRGGGRGARRLGVRGARRHEQCRDRHSDEEANSHHPTMPGAQPSAPAITSSVIRSSS